jgi:hypothetical protein
MASSVDEDGDDQDSHAVSILGRTGEVLVGTTDPARPGEISVAVRGGTETFIAYCSVPLVRHSTVLVIEELGRRRVAVTPWTSI